MVTRCEVLAIGAHPDDVELGCGALLARLAAAGRTVGIADLTAGELATRGTPVVRRAEAAAAAAALGVAWRTCLDLGDGALAGASPLRLVELIRGARPRVLLGPHGDDPHPDHADAARLVARASFLSGVANAFPDAGPAHRPGLVLLYAGPRQLLEPDLVVDITACYTHKREALACFASQFGGDGPATHLASGFFLAAVEGRDRAWGNLIGVELAEGLACPGTLAADELAWLLGG